MITDINHPHFKPTECFKTESPACCLTQCFCLLGFTVQILCLILLMIPILKILLTSLHEVLVINFLLSSSE